MTTLPKVSVIIPCYNCHDTLSRAVDSVICQEYPNIEIIVVDNASIVPIVDIIKKYGVKVTILRLEENLGPAGARNAGVGFACGEFIAFLDADDEWLPNHVAKQIHWMVQYPEVGFSFCNALNKNINGATTEVFQRNASSIALLDRLRVDDEIYFVNRNLAPAIIRSNFIFTPGVIVRRNFFNDLGGFDTHIRGPEDIIFWVKMSLNSPAIMITDIGFVRYLRAEGFSMQGERWLLEFLKALDLIALDVRDDPLALRSLHEKRISTYYSLILWYGRMGRYRELWMTARSAYISQNIDHTVFIAFICALGGRPGVILLNWFYAMKEDIWGRAK